MVAGMSQWSNVGRRRAFWSLVLVLAAACAAWALYVIGGFWSVRFDPAIGDASATGDALEASIGPAAAVGPSFTVAALAMLGVCSVIAVRRMRGVARSSRRLSRWVTPVFRVSIAAAIISACLAAIAAGTLFLGGMAAASENMTGAARALGIYLPIALHAVIVAGVILFGFVLVPEPGEPVQERAIPTPRASGTPRAGGNPRKRGGARPVVRPHRLNAPVALAWILPIAGVTVALFAGLATSDLGDALSTGWVWSIVLAVAAAGLAAGRWLSRRALTARLPTSSGASLFNTTLAVLFVVFAGVTSMVFARTSAATVTASPSVELSAYGNEETSSDDASIIPLTDASIDLWGGDLEPGSRVSVKLDGDEIFATTADRDGQAEKTKGLPSIAEGEHELTGTGTSRRGTEVSVTMPLTATADGTLEFTGGVDTFSDPVTEVLALTAAWLAREILPAALMMLLAIAVIAVTVLARDEESAAE